MSLDDLKNVDIEFYKNVILLNAGGTINMKGDDSRKPANGVTNIIQNIKDSMSKFNIYIETIDLFDRPPDSTNIGQKEWTEIYRKVVDILERKRVIEIHLRSIGIQFEQGGIVIAHGTDTLQTTSMMLSLMLSQFDLNIPVVFTGSHSPFGVEGSDAKKNLQKSIYVAKERFITISNPLPGGVYVLIGQDIHLATRLAKVYTSPNSEGKYFFSYPAPIGQVTGENYQIKINKAYLAKIYQRNSIFTIPKGCPDYWGIVEHEVLDKFSSIEILQDFRRRVNYYRSNYLLEGRSIGIVIQGNFSRNEKFRSIIETLYKLYEEDVYVLVGSLQVYTQALQLINKPFLQLIHRSMSHSKSREKLSWLLGYRLRREEINKLMNINIAGEVFEISELPEWIKYETFPPRIESKELIVLYPNIHKKVFIDAINRLLTGRKCKGLVTLYGFGNGHMPVANQSIIESIDIYLKERNLIVNRGNGGELDTLLKCVKALTSTIRDDKKIVAYMNEHYVVIKKNLKAAVYAEIENRQKQELVSEVTESLEAVILDLNNAGKTFVKLDKQDLELFLKTQKLMLNATSITNEWELFEGIETQEALLYELVKKYPILITRRLIRDAMISSHSTLEVLGTAIDRGINVSMRTQAPRSRTNLNLYEVGNILQTIGINSDIGAGWNTRYFMPKYLTNKYSV